MQTAKEILGVIGLLGAAGGGVMIIYKIVHLLVQIKKLNDLTLLLIRGVWAALDGLEQAGANGEVTSAKHKLRDYVINN